jgi:hypothetical protein
MRVVDQPDLGYGPLAAQDNELLIKIKSVKATLIPR